MKDRHYYREIFAQLVKVVKGKSGHEIEMTYFFKVSKFDNSNCSYASCTDHTYMFGAVQAIGKQNVD